MLRTLLEYEGRGPGAKDQGRVIGLGLGAGWINLPIKILGIYKDAILALTRPVFCIGANVKPNRSKRYNKRK